MTIQKIVLSLLILLAAAGRAAPVYAQTKPDGPDVDVPTAPGVLDGVELFRARGVSSFPAATRASAIENRILEAARDRNLDLTSLRVHETPGAQRLMAGD